MKITKNTKKMLLMLTVIFTLSTGFFVLYYSMDPKLTSGSFKSIKENMQTLPSTEPKSSTTSMDITKRQIFWMEPQKM